MKVKDSKIPTSNLRRTFPDNKLVKPNVEEQVRKRVSNLPQIETAIRSDSTTAEVPKKEPVPVTKEVPKKQTMKTSSVGGTVIQNNVTNIKQADTTVAQNNQPKSNKPIIMDVQYGVFG